MSADRHLAYLLELRLRTRHNPGGRSIVDRCLALLARAGRPGGPSAEELDAELSRIRDELVQRYGAPSNTAVH